MDILKYRNFGIMLDYDWMPSGMYFDPRMLRSEQPETVVLRSVPGLEWTWFDSYNTADLRQVAHLPSDTEAGHLTVEGYAPVVRPKLRYYAIGQDYGKRELTAAMKRIFADMRR